MRTDEPLVYKLDTENCASYYYAWNGSRFKLIRKVTAVPVAR